MAQLTVQETVAIWGHDLLRNMGKELPTLSYNQLHAAIADLKAKIAVKPEEESK